MKPVTKAQSAALKKWAREHGVVTKGCEIFSTRNEVYGGFDRQEHWYNIYSAPASDLATRERVAGSFLFDEHPTRPASHLFDRPIYLEYIGVGAVVYLQDCFNYSRIYREIFHLKPSDVISGSSNPVAEMGLIPLTITHVGWFSNYREYTLSDGVREFKVNESGYPKFQVCLLEEHPSKLEAYQAQVRAIAEEQRQRGENRKNRDAELLEKFQNAVNDRAARISVGSTLGYGTDLYRVTAIEGEDYHLDHWRNAKVIKKHELLNYSVIQSAGVA